MEKVINYSEEYRKKSLEVLEKALTLEAYRGWRRFDPGADVDIDRRYAAMPALTKDDIRQYFPRGFVPPEKDIETGLKNGVISLVKTSGSSDARVTNIWNQSWWDASERASWQLNSHAARLATGDHPEAILASPRNVGIPSDEIDLPMEKRRLGRFLYLNEKTDPTSWTSELMDRMLGELEVFQPELLEANPSYLARLCRYAATKHKNVFQPGLIVLTYEYPSVLHLRDIRRVFSAPVASSYGSTETGYVFMQCEEGKLHQNSDYCRVDLEPMKREHGGPELCRILVTTFGNDWYYMVRFDVGDLGRIEPSGSCPCGRDSGIILSAIEGRFSNATLTTDARLVTLKQLDDALGRVEGIEQYRLEQPEPGIYRLMLTTGIYERDDLIIRLKECLRQLYGETADISTIFLDDLKPDESGKYTLATALFPLYINDFLEIGQQDNPEKKAV